MNSPPTTPAAPGARADAAAAVDLAAQPAPPPADGGPDQDLKRQRTESLAPTPPEGVQAAALAPAKPGEVAARPPEPSPAKSPPATGAKADGEAAESGAAANKSGSKRQRDSAGAGYAQMAYPPFPPGVFPPGAFGAPWLGVGPLPSSAGSKKQQALMQQQQIALWHQQQHEYAARMALWQQQHSSQGQALGGPKGSSTLQSKMNKVKTNYNKGLMKEAEGGSVSSSAMAAAQSQSSMPAHSDPMAAGATASRGVGPSASAGSLGT